MLNDGKALRAIPSLSSLDLENYFYHFSKQLDATSSYFSLFTNFSTNFMCLSRCSTRFRPYAEATHPETPKSLKWNTWDGASFFPLSIYKHMKHPWSFQIQTAKHETALHAVTWSTCLDLETYFHLLSHKIQVIP